jgi:cell division protein FtsB
VKTSEKNGEPQLHFYVLQSCSAQLGKIEKKVDTLEQRNKSLMRENQELIREIEGLGGKRSA